MDFRDFSSYSLVAMNELPVIKVQPFTVDMMPSLMELAREVEPLFEGTMAEDRGFHEFVHRKVAQHEALAVCDRLNSNEVMGVIAFSHHNSAISWLAVFERYRGKGVGSELLSQALRELGDDNPIRVVTFREDNSGGIPARRLYKRFGFADSDPDYVYNGLPRCVMVRSPQGHSTNEQR